MINNYIITNREKVLRKPLTAYYNRKKTKQKIMERSVIETKIWKRGTRQFKQPSGSTFQVEGRINEAFQR